MRLADWLEVGLMLLSDWLELGLGGLLPRSSVVRHLQ